MARFDIISKDGSIVRYSGKPRYNGSYLKPSFLEFSEIASPVPISWEVGDYVDYPRTGMRYRLYSIPQPSKNARKDSHGRAFTYSNVQLHAATKELEIALFRDLVSNDNNIHFSTSPDVATFEDVYGIARRIQACMDDLYPSRWEIRVADFDESEDAEIIEKISEAKDFALSGGTCLDALSKIYELWQDIGWIHSYENGKEVVTIGYANKRIADNTSDAYLYGKGNGLTAIKKNQTNKDEFATRLYVYGSERNLPSRYYNGLNILNAESVDIRNLMLPLDSWGQTDGLPDARKAYLENSDAVAKFGVIPKTHYFDSTDAGADIYPTIERLTIGEIRNAMSPDDDYYPSESYADTDRADAVLDVINPADDGVLKRDGKEYDAITYVGLQSVDKKVNVVGGISNAPIIINHPLFSKVVDTDFSRGKVVVELSQAITIPDRGYTSVSARVEVGDSEEIGYGASYGYMDLGATKSDDGKNWIIKLGRISVDYSKILYDTHKFPIYGFLTIDANTIGAESGETTIKLGPGSGTIGIKRVLDKTFNITLKQIGFDINEQASLGKGKTISMKTGACAGRNFVISDCFYSSANDSWVLTCKRQQDDTLGMLFPNNAYEIAGGDIFVLVDIAMPSLYIGVAMNRLLSEGQKLLARASKIQSHYEPAIDAKVMVESGRTLREGMFMEIIDEDVIDNTTEYILIDTLSIYEDESAIPTYKVTLRERRKVTYKGTPSATSTTSTKSVEEDVDKEDIVVDLTNYYTKGEIDAKGYLTPAALNDYAKTSEVSETYATKIALSAVDGRLVSLESYFSTSEDADTQINKWNEIVAFLNATEGTTLAGILAAYYTKAEVDNKVTTINNSITALDDKYAPVKTWYDALASLIVKDGNNVRIKTNLIVEGDTASGGEGGGSSSVGIQGIRLNGQTYYDITDGVEDGIIDLGTIGGGTITEITSEMITEALGYTPANSASLGSLATKDSVAWSEVTGKVTSAGVFSFIDSTFALSALWFNYRTLQNTNLTTPIESYHMGNGAIGYAGVVASKFIVKGGTSSQFLKADGSLDSTSYLPTSGGRASDLTIEGSGTAWLAFGNSSGTSFGSIGVNSSHEPKFWNGSGAFTIYHTGNFNPADYLPLSGGTITIDNPKGITIKRNASSAGALLWFANNAGYLGAICVTANKTLLFDNDTTAYDILHAGNYSDYALPLTGGKITSSSYLPLIIESTASNNYVAIRLKNASTLRSLGIKSDGTLFVTNVGGWDAEYPILHSGNVGEYAFTTAAKTLTSSDTLDAHLTGIYGYKDGNNPTNSFGQNAAVLSLKGIKSNPVFQLAFDGNTTSVGYRNQNYAGTWSTWKTIAFTDSNVESAKYMATLFSDGSGWYTNRYRLYGQYDSVDGQTLELKTEGGYKVRTDIATKLATARTIWGQSFDGTGNITGSLQLNNGIAIYVKNTSGSFKDALKMSSSDNFMIGYGVSEAGHNTYLEGNNIYLRYGQSHSSGLILNSSGNVGIGKTSPSSKLSVDSNAASSLPSLGALATKYTIEFGYAGKYGTYLGTLGSGIGFIQQGRSDGTATAYNLLLQPLGGYVLIGTTTEKESGPLLQVNGGGYFGTDTYLANWAYLRSYKTDGSKVSVIGINNNNLLLINGVNSGVNTAILGGEVGIGTTDPLYKLDVAGTGRFTGAVTMASTLEVTRHATIYGGAYLRGGVEVYGSTPYIDFHFGNATDDYTSRIIEIASGNLAVNANWLPNTNNAKKLGNSDKRWSEIFGVNGNLSGTLDVGGASTFNGKLTIDLGATQQALRVNGESTLNGSVSIIKALSVGGLSNLGNGAILGGTTRPSLDNTHSLGIDGYRWSILYAVNGNLSGNLIVSGDVASGSDVRFKDIVTYHRFKTEDIANAPLFTFRWNDRKDKAEHLGTSAQYWENVAPWLVKGEDFKTLDYSTLGVAIGISLANKTMNHDERIKTLEKEIKTLRDEIRSIRHGIC